MGGPRELAKVKEAERNLNEAEKSGQLEQRSAARVWRATNCHHDCHWSKEEVSIKLEYIDSTEWARAQTSKNEEGRREQQSKNGMMKDWHSSPAQD
jgi:hypothetical protein